MKIRPEFVTNSSSSSFIFGEPGGNTIQIADVVDTLRQISKDILKAIELLDTIVNSDPELKAGVELCRSNNLSSDDYKKKWEFEHRLEDDKALCATINNSLKDSGFEVSWDDFVYNYLNAYDLEKIKLLAENKSNSDIPLMSSIVDLRDPENYDCSDEILYWYEDDLEESVLNQLKQEKAYEDSTDTEEKLKLVHKYYGEVAILGECGYLPSLIVQILFDKCKYGCDHMG